MKPRRTFILLAAFAPLAALAHSHLESSVPAQGSTLTASPDNVVLMFSEAVDLTALELQKKGAASKTKLTPLPAKMSAHLMVPLPKLAEGEYTLSYKVLSTDTHESTGTVSFKVVPKAQSGK